jgi:hypothetical protein
MQSFKFTSRWTLRCFVSLVLGSATLSAAVFHYAEDGTSRRRWSLVDLNPQVPDTIVDPTTRTVMYYVADDLFSGPGTESELNAIKAVFDQWSATPGSALKYTFAGMEDAAGADVNLNGRNVVFWVKENTLVNDGQVNISGALGFAFSSFFLSSQTLAEVDIVLNGKIYDWSSDYKETSFIPHLIEGVLTHEVGHMTGLQHSPGGGTTMFVRGRSGTRTVQIGLSMDEILGARTLYPDGSQEGTSGSISGVVTMSGSNVLGACIFIEDTDGNLISSTLSRADGSFEFPLVPAGNYTIWASPMDENLSDSNFSMLTPREISQEFNNSKTIFLPTDRTTIQVTTGQTAEFNFNLVEQVPPFRITRIRDTSESEFAFTRINAPTRIQPGAQNVFVGVYGQSLPVDNPEFEISGNDITIHEVTAQFNQGGSGNNLVGAKVSVASTAKPGLRTFIVRDAQSVAYAAGFIEVSPLKQDYNFDGLDDEFQRDNFDLFTSPEAGPEADPDLDGFVNRIEKEASSNPNDANSVPSIRLNSMVLGLNGARISWTSFPGLKYQVWRRGRLNNGIWESVGAPVVASGSTSEFLDPEATEMMYYRVQLVQ